MHAYIITGGTEETRSKHINDALRQRKISPLDCISIHPEPVSIGIGEIRAILSRLALSPLGATTHAVIVYAAHTMTPEAQNAFLKTLEEPPGMATIYLETGEPGALLPTILSRCQIIPIGGIPDRGQSDNTSESETSQNNLKTIEKLLSASPGEQLNIIDSTIKTRDDALAFVDLSIQVLASHLKSTGLKPVNSTTSLHLSEIQTAQLLRRLLSARTQIMGNITPKLALDCVFLPDTHSVL